MTCPPPGYVGAMVDLNQHALPAAGTEAEVLLAVLDRNRRTFAWKAFGPDAEGMRRRLAPSTMTLGGLAKHLALVEDHYFTHLLLGRPYPDVWAPLADDPDWDWHSAADDSPEEIRALWEAAVARSHAAVDEALADGGLDRLLDLSPDEGEPHNLRRTVVDLIEEYARHTGHADLIRESIDGLVGEGEPPA